jgi:predicted membrane protein
MKHKHLLLMALCCLIPVVLIAAFLYAGVESRYLYFLLILLCPLMHLLTTIPRRRKESLEK